VNILFITENFPPETNAAATRVYERALYWVKWGHAVTVITQAPNFPQGRLFPGYHNYWREVEDVDGIRVVRVMTFISANRGVVRRALDFLSFGLTATWAGLCERKPDVVCATSPQFFAAVAAWLVGKAKRVPFVFELGDLWPLSISAVGAMKKGRALEWLEKLELRLYRDAAAVAALTHAFKRNLVSRGIDPAKIHVVLNGVDLPRYAPRPREEILAAAGGLTGRFGVGYVGPLGMAHGLANVLDAAARLVDETRIRFLFVGAGAEREMLVDAADERALPNVIFAPPQPKEEMPTVWSLCDVALVHLKDSPAFAEVIPSKIFEAMAMGLPILFAAPAGEASALIERHGAGLCVPAGDPDALAQAVLALADDSEGRTRLARAGLAAAPQHSRETQAREMLAVFETAVTTAARTLAR
jgi:glycosyltransferase involved in cell wall biosynthesis